MANLTNSDFVHFENRNIESLEKLHSKNRKKAGCYLNFGPVALRYQKLKILF